MLSNNAIVFLCLNWYYQTFEAPCNRRIHNSPPAKRRLHITILFTSIQESYHKPFENLHERMLYCQIHVNRLVPEQLPWWWAAFCIISLATCTNSIDPSHDWFQRRPCSIYAQIRTRERPAQMTKWLKRYFETQLNWVHAHAKMQCKKFRTHEAFIVRKWMKKNVTQPIRFWSQTWSDRCSKQTTWNKRWIWIGPAPRIQWQTYAKI